MANDEVLREALIELDALRQREALALRESTALVSCLSAVATAPDAETGLASLLVAIQEVVDCQAVTIIKDNDGRAEVLASTMSTLIGVTAPQDFLKGAKPKRIVSLADAVWWPPGEGWPKMGSALSASVQFEGAKGALVCLAERIDGFSVADARILPRLAEVAMQAFSTVQLSRRNEFLAGVIDGSAASVSIADLRIKSTPLIYVNDAFTTLSGYSREEVLGRNCRFLSAETDDSEIRTQLRKAVASAEVGEFELRNQRKDGVEFWNRLTLYPIDGEDGVPCFLVATQVDITAEKSADAAREMASRRLRSALSATSEGFLLLNPNGRVVFANNQYRDFFESPSTEWSDGADFVTIWTARLTDEGAPETEALQSARSYRDDLFAGAKGGEVILADGRVVLINNQPTAEGGAVSIATDITSLKATERILAQRVAAIDASQDGIAVADHTGRLLYANASYLAMYGYDHQYEVLGKSWRSAFAEDQWDRIEREAIPALLKRGTWRAEMPGISKSGTQVLQEVSVTFADGIGVVCIARDMNQRVKARSERAKLIEQLQSAQRQEAIGQLAAGVAHDFNNVLSAITGSAALIETDLSRGLAVDGHIGRIQQAGVQAQGLIKRLLDFGARRSTKKETELGQLVKEAMDLLRSGVPQRIDLSLNLPDDPILASADPTDLIQIILNLGINARDAIGQSEGKIDVGLAMMDQPPETVQVGAVENGRSYALITVTDTGQGMSAKQTESIFKAYFSTKGDEGTGLGLSVVSTIIRSLGGAIAVTSEPGVGTAFTIFYPTEEFESAENRREMAAESGSDLKGRLILICDDNISVAETHSAILESAGAETAVVEDPRDALDALQEDPGAWDALLTDFDMPHMNGAELAEAARAARADLPIVLCTAYDLHRRSSATFDGEIEKPATPADLISALAAAIKTERR